MVKIVLTGGPCGGKSSAREHLTKLLEERGYKVLFIPEGATELIIGGVIPGNGVSLEDFQKLVFKCQIDNEALFGKAAEIFGDKTVIFCDRGIMDQAAYLDRERFGEIIKEEAGMDFADAFARYDAVLHLRTAALGAEEFYQWNDPSKEDKGNNEARMDSPERARQLDQATLACWIGHPHLRVIENRGTFEEKIQDCVKEVFDILGEPVPMETERKFLIKKPTMEQLSMLGATAKTNIVQTYLKSEDGTERRVRQRGTKKDGYTFYYTEKRDVSPGVREELEKKISKGEYVELLAEADTSLHQVSKERTCFIYDGKYFELDEYPFNDEFCILEIELGSIDEEFAAPPFTFVKEVTNDTAYKNHSLAGTQAFPELTFEEENEDEEEMER